MCPEGQIGTPPNCTESAPRKDDDGSSMPEQFFLGAVRPPLWPSISSTSSIPKSLLWSTGTNHGPAAAPPRRSPESNPGTTTSTACVPAPWSSGPVPSRALRAPSQAASRERWRYRHRLGRDTPPGLQHRVSMMPEMAVSARRGPALDIGGNIEGGRYALQGGWRGDALFVDTSLSHGGYRMHSFMENPAVGGLLAGELDLTQDHAQGQAGLRLDLGRVRATPSVSLFSGSLRARRLHRARRCRERRGARNLSALFRVAGQARSGSLRLARWSGSLELAAESASRHDAYPHQRLRQLPGAANRP